MLKLLINNSVIISKTNLVLLKYCIIYYNNIKPVYITKINILRDGMFMQAEKIGQFIYLNM